MSDRKLPTRERMFVAALQYHGFCFAKRNQKLKRSKGYVIPATERENSGGIDFWVRMPRSERLLPVQITQRGTMLFKKYLNQKQETSLDAFKARSERRIRDKRKWCKRDGIAFVLVRDYAGERLDTVVAWGDIKALRYAVVRIRKFVMKI